MLYVQDSSVIHSDQLGVHSQNTQRILFKSPEHVVVLRLVRRQEEAIKKVCDYARLHVGTQYSVPEAMASRFRRNSTSGARSNRQFCSRLVAEAYAFGGLSLVQNPSYCYPADLHNVELVAPIKEYLCPADATEITFARSRSPIQVQAEVTNTLFADLRTASGADLQTENQTVDFLKRRPKFDASFSKILASSGYLDLWKMETQANPWRYDKSALSAKRLTPENRQKEAESAKELIERYHFMHSNYSQLSIDFRLRYFGLQEALYRKLLELQLKRVSLMLRADA